MEQRLAEQKVKKLQKQNTQTAIVVKIWKNLDKSSFEKESNPEIKDQLKSGLYTEICKNYEEQQGHTINRATVRRCVNTYIKVSSQG